MTSEVRFGVRDQQAYSQYWKASVSKRGDIYVSSQRTGTFLHTSFHASHSHWHVKVRKQTGDVVHRIPVPDDVTPGTRRLLLIYVPRGVITYERPGRARQVTWVDPPSDDHHWVMFTILMSDGPPPLVSGAHTLGHLGLSGGGIVTLIAQEVVGQDGEASFTASPKEVARVRAQMNAGSVRAIMQGRSPDKATWFLELRAEASTGSTQTEFAE